MNSLPKTVTRQRRDCDLNLGPTTPESSTLTTRLPNHPMYRVLFAGSVDWRAAAAARRASQVADDRRFVHRGGAAVVDSSVTGRRLRAPRHTHQPPPPPPRSGQTRGQTDRRTRADRNTHQPHRDARLRRRRTLQVRVRISPLY